MLFKFVYIRRILTVFKSQIREHMRIKIGLITYLPSMDLTGRYQQGFSRRRTRVSRKRLKALLPFGSLGTQQLPSVHLQQGTKGFEQQCLLHCRG